MLKLRRLGIDIYQENVAFLSRSCTDYRPEEFRALKKIQINGATNRVFATLVVADNTDLVGPDELGLSTQTFEQLSEPEGALVTIGQAQPPSSLEAVRNKIRGHTLTPDDIQSIISDITARRYSEMEIAAFLIASASLLTETEVLSLTLAMADAGNRLTWDAPIVVDKHCIGGIPGNRTSMIVVPIVAAHGLPIPKTSSRAITSPAGTADTMEVLTRVDISVEKIRDIVNREGGCLVWGGHVNLSPADDILISVERPLGIDTREQMVASIMSKKLAAGSTHLLIDIPVGPTAKIRSHMDAIRLRKLFEFIGDNVGLNVFPVITDGSQPIGRGIGPALEARDVMAVLKGKPEAPPDLREKALQLAGRIIDFDPELRGGAGYGRAQDLLESGQALAQMERIIDAQGTPPSSSKLGHLVEEIVARHDGVVRAIDCYRLARVARLAGAPIDKGAGIDLLKKLGDPVTAGEPLYRIHACIDSDFRFASNFADENHGYEIHTIS